MKKIAIFLIDFYQTFISTALKNILGVSSFCRFEETCSSYAKGSIKRFGLVKGSYLFFKRLIICQPFYSGGLEPKFRRNFERRDASVS